MTPTTKPDPRKFDLLGDRPTITLTQNEVQSLGKLLRRNLTDKDSLIAAVAALNSVSVEGQVIRLELRLLQRLHTRCADKGRFGAWLAETIVKQLHDFAGW